MKLFAKYSRINVIAILIIFLVASIAFYFSLRLVVIHQIDQDLEIEEKEISTYVAEHNRLPENISVSDQFLSYQPVAGPVPRRFSTASILEPGDNKKEDSRQLVFGTAV